MIPIKSNSIYPEYTLEIPSSGKTLTYRPFIEKERKILLIAAESDAKDEILQAIKNILIACCDNIDVNSLTIFDVEYIFLQLRAKSIGETSNLNFRCDNVVEGKSCNNIMKIEVDLSKIKVENISKENKIKFTDYFGLKMKYPTIDIIKSKYSEKERDYFYYIASKCIEFIYENENIYYMKDYSEEDQIEFIQSLTFNQIEKIEQYVENLPSLKKVIKKRCDKCQYEHEITLEGYQSFFI